MVVYVNFQPFSELIRGDYGRGDPNFQSANPEAF